MPPVLTREQTQRQVTLPSGLSMNVHEAGQGATLLLLHGSGPGVSAWSNFRHNLPVFAGSFRTVMPDMPGFGETPLPDKLDNIYSVITARHILELLDELEIRTAHVLGNSMGGNVATELALLAPDRVSRLVLMGPGGLSVNVFGPEISEGTRLMRAFLDKPDRAGLIAWLTCMVHDPALITKELIEERWATAMAPGAIAAAKAIFGTFYDPALASKQSPLWARAGEVKQPTLIAWGRDDRQMLYESAHFAMRRLPDAELHTFSNCGHWAQVERKDAFERLVIEFLTRA